jgi:hypothetical protein
VEILTEVLFSELIPRPTDRIQSFSSLPMRHAPQMGSKSGLFISIDSRFNQTIISLDCFLILNSVEFLKLLLLYIEGTSDHSHIGLFLNDILRNSLHPIVRDFMVLSNFGNNIFFV